MAIARPQDCSRYPWWCAGQCAELNACRSGNNPIGGSNCHVQESNLRLCEVSPPPAPPVIAVPPSPDRGDGDEDGEEGDSESDCQEEADGDGKCDYCEDGDGDSDCDPPGVRIEPGSRDCYIEPSGRMPRMEFQARMSNADAFLKDAGIKFKDVWFKWKLEMAYDDTDDGGIFDYGHRIPPGVARKKVMGTGIWRPDWGSLVSGADTVTFLVQPIR